MAHNLSKLSRNRGFVKNHLFQNCEVSWSLQKDPVQHTYNMEGKDGIHAVMVHGETLIPGVKIRILDQLSLYGALFYINDRGLDPKTEAFFYGNQRGVPYRLERVSTLVDDERESVNKDLEWTMGPRFRTDKDYKDNIDATVVTRFHLPLPQ